MAIKFRCQHCQTLMSIASRKAGSMVRCAACDEEVLVPLENPVLAPASPPAPVAPNMPEPTANLADDEELDRVALPDDLFHFEEDQADADQAADRKLPSDEPAFLWGKETLDFAQAAAEVDAGRSPAVEDAALGLPPSRPAPRPELESDNNPFQVKLRKSTIDDEMDLTPMVDVVFQLLIFFMVTASFALHKTIQTPTPESNQKGATQSIQSLDELEGVAILVRIDAQNGIFIDEDPLTDGAPVADALTDKMRKEHKSEIIITADATAWHRTVVKVVDAANEVGMQKIRLATRSGPAD